MASGRADSADRARPIVEARQRLATHTATAMLAEAALDPVPGGMSNYAWRATTTQGAWFVRLAHPLGSSLGADLVSECRVLTSAAAAGLAPAVVVCDPADRLLVTRWIDQAPDHTTNRGERRLAETARTLARLHATVAPQGTRTVDFAAQARHLEQLGGTHRYPGLELDATRAFAWLAERQAPLVLCHNDLNPLNLLFDRDGKLWLVDWEYAGLGDAAFDLASYASQHALSARGRRALVQEYCKAGGGAVDQPRFEVADWAFDYVQWLWYLATLESNEGAADRAATAATARRLERSLRRRAMVARRWNNPPFAGLAGQV